MSDSPHAFQRRAMSLEMVPKRRKMILISVGVLLILQSALSLANTFRSLSNLDPSELPEDLVRTGFLLGVTLLYLLALRGKVRGVFRRIVLFATWLDLVVTGILLVLFGALFSLMFPAPIVFLTAAALFPWAVGRTTPQ